MAIRYWKKMRDDRRDSAAGAPGARPNPWHDGEEPPTLSQLHVDVDLTDSAEATDAAGEVPVDDRAARYNEWAERLRAKRQRVRQMQAEHRAEAEGRPEVGGANYWNTDALYEESKRVEEEELYERPNPWRVRELLAALDLREDATPTEVSKAYHRLAKVHHPDRFASAPEDEQRFHEEKMRSINAAYRSLRQLERA